MRSAHAEVRLCFNHDVLLIGFVSLRPGVLIVCRRPWWWYWFIAEQRRCRGRRRRCARTRCHSRQTNIGCGRAALTRRRWRRRRRQRLCAWYVVRIYISVIVLLMLTAINAIVVVVPSQMICCTWVKSNQKTTNRMSTKPMLRKHVANEYVSCVDVFVDVCIIVCRLCLL